MSETPECRIAGRDGAGMPGDLPHDLPPRDTRRWVASRKAQVARAVETGILPEDSALRIYGLTCEELDLWRQALRTNGVQALKVTRMTRKNGGRD